MDNLQRHHDRVMRLAVSRWRNAGALYNCSLGGSFVSTLQCQDERISSHPSGIASLRKLHTVALAEIYLRTLDLKCDHFVSFNWSNPPMR